MVKIFWLSFWIFVADRLTKAMAVGIDKIQFFPFLNFIYVENPGAAFGSFPTGRIFLILVTFGVLYAMYKYRDYLTENHPIATGLILGGALGNLFDRIFEIP